MRSLIVAFALTAIGCAGAPLTPEQVAPLPSVKPVACLSPCKVNSCVLPGWYDTATPEDQAALELNCWIVNSEEARQCVRDHQCLAEWAGSLR